LLAPSVWTGYRAQTRSNAHEQAFANIIRLMSVHQRNLIVRARSLWTDFLGAFELNKPTELGIFSNIAKHPPSAHLVCLDSYASIHEFRKRLQTTCTTRRGSARLICTRLKRLNVFIIFLVIF
jgi:hypothetical protein